MQTSLSDLFLELKTLTHLVCDHEGQKKSPEDLLPLSFFYDPRRHLDPLAIIKAMPKGSSFIFRHFGLSHIVKKAEILRAEAKKKSILFMVGQDYKLARSVKADGLHVPHWDWCALDNPMDLPLSASAHNHNDLESLLIHAQRLSRVFVSPVFHSQSPSAFKNSVWGPKALNEAVNAYPLCLHALGGSIGSVYMI